MHNIFLNNPHLAVMDPPVFVLDTSFDVLSTDLPRALTLAVRTDYTLDRRSSWILLSARRDEP